MPRLDGIGLCRAVRVRPAHTSMPVILWSSVAADAPRLVEAVALGGVEFVSKSLAVSAIDSALRRILHPPGSELAELGARVGAEGDDQGCDRLPADVAA